MNKNIEFNIIGITIQLFLICFILKYEWNFSYYLLIIINSIFIIVYDSSRRLESVSTEYVPIFKKLVALEKFLIVVAIIIIIVKYANSYSK